MSHEVVFHILPFDPRIVIDAKTQLPIDLDDFAHQLRKKWPAGEVRIDKIGSEINVSLHISTERFGTWHTAGFTESPSQFEVSGWPKHVAKELIFWYRHYVPLKHPLFLVIPESGYVAELTAHTTLDDIERMYPFPVPDE